MAAVRSASKVRAIRFWSRGPWSTIGIRLLLRDSPGRVLGVPAGVGVLLGMGELLGVDELGTGVGVGVELSGTTPVEGSSSAQPDITSTAASSSAIPRAPVTIAQYGSLPGQQIVHRPQNRYADLSRSARSGDMEGVALAGGQRDQAGIHASGRVQAVREERQVLGQRGRRDSDVVPVSGRGDLGRVGVGVSCSVVSSTKYQYAVAPSCRADLDVLGGRVARRSATTPAPC